MKKLTRWALQTLFILSLVISAQPKQAYAQTQQPAQTAPAPERGDAAVPAKNEASQEGKSERELTQASKEAGKEGKESADEPADDTAKFKYSKSVAWFSNLTGMDVKTGYWVFTILNFVVIFGAMFWIFKSIWPNVVRTRNERISRALEEARRTSEESRRRLSEIEARLSKLDTEISGIKSQAETEAVAEEQRIKAASEEERQRILTAAEQEITSASAQARRELKSFAAQIAIDLAKARIASGIDANSDEQLVREFASRLGKEGNA